MKSILFVLCAFCLVNLYSQNNNKKSYLSLTVDNGKMLNAEPGFLRMGVGTTVTYLMPNYIPVGAGCNYITFSASLINYPHTGVSYSLSHFNNGVDDAFHYVKLLVGYRISIRFADQYGNYSMYFHHTRIEGLSFEPRIGTALYNLSFSNPTMIISPRLNYVRKGFYVSAYYDYGQAREHTNIGCRTIFSVGVGIGYNIKL